MTAPTFKQYSELLTADRLPSDEQLCEIFGFFRNNDKLDKLKAEREKLRRAKTEKEKQVEKDKDAMFRAAKYQVDRGGKAADAFAKGSNTPRAASAAARGRAAERDWVDNLVGESAGDAGILADLWEVHGAALVEEFGDDPTVLQRELLKLVNPAVARRLDNKATRDWIEGQVRALAEASGSRVASRAALIAKIKGSTLSQRDADAAIGVLKDGPALLRPDQLDQALVLIGDEGVDDEDVSLIRSLALTEGKGEEAEAGETMFVVDVPAYVYSPRGYVYQSVPVRVLASSADEAGELVNQHRADVRRHLEARKHPGSGKPLIDPKRGRGVVFKDSYHVKPAAQAAGRAVLTRHGGFKPIRG